MKFFNFFLVLTVFTSLNSYASEKLDFFVTAKVESIKLDKDGDYLGAGQIKVTLFREGLDPFANESSTKLTFGNKRNAGDIRGTVNVNSGQLLTFKNEPNFLKGTQIKTITNRDELKKATFSLFISESDCYGLSSCATTTESKNFPLLVKSINFNLSELTNKDSITRSQTISFPIKNNTASITIRFSKLSLSKIIEDTWKRNISGPYVTNSADREDIEDFMELYQNEDVPTAVIFN